MPAKPRFHVDDLHTGASEVTVTQYKPKGQRCHGRGRGVVVREAMEGVVEEVKVVVRKAVKSTGTEKNTRKGTRGQSSSLQTQAG